MNAPSPIWTTTSNAETHSSGTDFYKSQQIDLFDEEQKYKVNAFDWETEFKDIFKNGGFDVSLEIHPMSGRKTLGQEFKEYAEKHFETYAGTADLYIISLNKRTNF